MRSVSPIFGLIASVIACAYSGGANAAIKAMTNETRTRRMRDLESVRIVRRRRTNGGRRHARRRLRRDDRLELRQKEFLHVAGALAHGGVPRLDDLVLF